MLLKETPPLAHRLFAVCDHVEEFLEHLDAVQVSEKTRETFFIKRLLVNDIHLTYVCTIFAQCFY